MRELTDQERVIVKLAREKFGAHERDEIVILESGEAILQVWGEDGDGPWVHLTNLGAWLSEGVLSEDEIKNTQM